MCRISITFFLHKNNSLLKKLQTSKLQGVEAAMIKANKPSPLFLDFFCSRSKKSRILTLSITDYKFSSPIPGPGTYSQRSGPCVVRVHSRPAFPCLRPQIYSGRSQEHGPQLHRFRQLKHRRQSDYECTLWSECHHLSGRPREVQQFASHGSLRDSDDRWRHQRDRSLSFLEYRHLFPWRHGGQAERRLPRWESGMWYLPGFGLVVPNIGNQAMSRKRENRPGIFRCRNKWL